MPASKITPLLQTQDRKAQSASKPVEENPPKPFEYKKWMVRVGFPIVLMGILFGLMLFQSHRAKENSSSLVHSSINAQSQLEPRADLEKLKKIANKYAFLRAHLDAPLSQEFLNSKQLDQARSLNHRLETRMGSYLKPVCESNQITLLVAEKKYAEALERSQALKNEIDPYKFPVLYFYQLARMAFLEKELGHIDQSAHWVDELSKVKGEEKLKDLALLDLGSLSFVDFMSLM